MQVARPSVAQSFPTGSSSQPAMYAHSPHGVMAAPSFNRSFSDTNTAFQQHSMEKPQIYTVRTPWSLFLPLLTQTGRLLGRICL